MNGLAFAYLDIVISSYQLQEIIGFPCGMKMGSIHVILLLDIGVASQLGWVWKCVHGNILWSCWLPSPSLISRLPPFSSSSHKVILSLVCLILFLDSTPEGKNILRTRILVLTSGMYDFRQVLLLRPDFFIYDKHAFFIWVLLWDCWSHVHERWSWWKQNFKSWWPSWNAIDTDTQQCCISILVFPKIPEQDQNC